jgi:hypothetical protein
MHKGGINQEDIAKRAYRAVAIARHSTHKDETRGAAEQHQMRLEVRSIPMHNRTLQRTGGIEARQ